MISLLIPTRGRRDGLVRTINSAFATAVGDVEAVCYIDDDDIGTYDGTEARLCNAAKNKVRFISGPRIVLSNTWNKCAEAARGEIFGQMNDDVEFRTHGWDKIVEKEFEQWPDKIVFVHGRDGSGNFASNTGQFGAHPFLHRRWMEVLGYLIPPYFSSDYGDTWNNDLADAIKRRAFVPVHIEHLHFYFGKAPVDANTKDRLKRHDADLCERLYGDLAPLREIDLEKLQAAMK